MKEAIVGAPIQNGEMSRRIEVVRGMEPDVRQMLDSGKYLLPSEKLWQPSDLLPDFRYSDWPDEVTELQAESEGAPPELWVGLVGNTVTEGALPAYLSLLTRITAIKDQTGADSDAWSQWARGWTAEESRHDRVLHEYLYLSGKVDMKAVDRTIQGLIANGFDSKAGDDPYNLFIYATLQEADTEIAHRNTANLFAKVDARRIAKVCGRTAGDERRHFNFYADVTGHIMTIDPDGGLVAFDTMLRNRIVMPGALMAVDETLEENQRQSDLFAKYSAVTQAVGILTPQDHLDVVENLLNRWDIVNLPVTRDDAKRAQDRLMTYPDRMARVFDRLSRHPIDDTPLEFPWIEGSISLKNPAISLVK